MRPHSTSGSLVKLAALAGGILSFVILAAGGGSPTDAAATPSVGPITTAVIVGTFSDSTTSVDMDAIKANFQGNPGHDVLSYFSETSYGKASIAPSFYGPYPLSTTSSIGCSSNSNQTLINVAAADIIYPQFSRLIFVYNCPGSDFGSATGVGPVSTPQGTVQAAQVALDANSAADLYSVVHELSHTLSNFLSHAGFYVCTPDAFIPPTRFDAGCISSEYGDAFDVLGGGPSHAVSQLNPFHKASAGWFGAGQFPTVSSPGTFTYTLAPYEQPTSGVLALNIPRGQSGTAWTVEYRQASGFDTWMASPTQCSGCTVTQGASIRLVTGGGGPGGGSDTQLIDTTPGTMTSSAYYSTSDGLDGALLPGRAFTDPEYGISIVAVSASASGLVVQVTIPAQTCVRGRPALSAPSPAAQTAGVGQIAIYSVTLTNNDSAGCAPNTFRYMPPSSATVRFVATPDFLSLAAGGTTTISLTASALPLTVAGSYGFSSADGSGAGIVRSNSIGMGDAIVSGLTFQLSATADATAPSAPSGLTANALGSNVVTLSWSPSTDNVGAIGYRVLRGAALFTTDTPSLVDAGVSAGTSYSYSVQAFDRRGNLSSATTVTVRPPAKIDFTAPTAAIVSATTGDHSLSVSWTASSDNVGIAYYRVYPCLVSSCLVPASVRSFAVEGLPTRTRYDLKVVAVDGDGNSSDPWVGAYTVYTAAGGDVAPPSQPQALVATAAVYGRVDLSWTASTDDAGVAGYDVYRNNRKIATATSTSYSDTLAGATSEYYVQAVDADGSLSAPSSRLWVSVPSSPSTTPTPGPLPSPTPSLAPTPTLSPAFTSTPSPAPTSTPSLAPTPTLSPAPTPTPTETPTATPTPVLSPSATDAPSPTPTPTATPTAAPAFTPTPTATPAPALAFPAGPLVQISQPSNGVVVPAGKTVVMLATASDDSGVAKVVFSVNGVSKCADNSAPYSCNWTVGTIQGTAYAITAAVVAKDGSAASQSFVVYGGLDTVSPVAQITFPADGDTVPAGKSVLLAVDAWDGAGVAKVEFYVNGARKCTDKAAPFTCGFSVGRGVDVSYRMYAIAYDFSGNSGVSQVITVTSR